MKKRIFSGIQPTGSTHIGNYLGAIKNWVKLQNDYDCVWCIVDLHALTNPDANNNLQEKIFDLATTYLAAGLDPKKAIIFIQSHVPEHTELTWLLNTVTPIAELERMTQFKEKSKQFKESINMGLFGYPVLMAADILIYKTNYVPVGEDQKQHVELARTISRKFNNKFGKTFTVPECLIQKNTARIMSLTDPTQKMAKSVPHSFLTLNDSSAIIKDKIKKAVTDSGKEIEYSPKKPAIANLMSIYSAFSNLSFSEIEKKFNGKGYGNFKNDLAELIIKELKPFQTRKKELEKNPAQIKKILDNGAKQARKIAQKNLLEIKKKMNLL